MGDVVAGKGGTVVAVFQMAGDLGLGPRPRRDRPGGRRGRLLAGLRPVRRGVRRCRCSPSWPRPRHSSVSRTSRRRSSRSRPRTGRLTRPDRGHFLRLPTCRARKLATPRRRDRPLHGHRRAVDARLVHHLQLPGPRPVPHRGPVARRPSRSRRSCIASLVGMVVSYRLSRHWTFRHRPPVHADGGRTAFFVINLVTLPLAVGDAVVQPTRPRPDRPALRQHRRQRRRRADRPGGAVLPVPDVRLPQAGHRQRDGRTTRSRCSGRRTA